eukprot:tig00021178_g19198.t1
MAVAAVLLVLSLASPACGLEGLFPVSSPADATVVVESGVAFGSAVSSGSSSVRWYYSVLGTPEAHWSGTVRQVAVLCELQERYGSSIAPWAWKPAVTPQERLDAVRTRGAIATVTYKTDLQLTTAGSGAPATTAGYRLDSVALVLNGSRALARRSAVDGVAICPTPLMFGSPARSQGTSLPASSAFRLIVVPWSSALVPADWRLPASPSAQLLSLLEGSAWTPTSSYPHIIFPSDNFHKAGNGTCRQRTGLSSRLNSDGEQKPLVLQLNPPLPAPLQIELASVDPAGVDIFVVEASHKAVEDSPNRNDRDDYHHGEYCDSYADDFQAENAAAFVRAIEGHSAGAPGFGGGLLLARALNFSSRLVYANQGRNSMCFAYIGTMTTSTGPLSYTVDDARLTVSGGLNNAQREYRYKMCERPCMPGLKMLIAARATDGVPLAFSFFSVDVDRIFKTRRYLACFVSPTAPSAYVCRFIDTLELAPRIAEASTANPVYIKSSTTLELGSGAIATAKGWGSSYIGTPSENLQPSSFTIHNFAFNDTLSWSLKEEAIDQPEQYYYSTSNPYMGYQWPYMQTWTSRTPAAPPISDIRPGLSGTIPASAAPSTVSFDQETYSYSSVTITLRPRASLPPGNHAGRLSVSYSAPSFSFKNYQMAFWLYALRIGYEVAAGYNATLTAGSSTDGYFSDQILTNWEKRDAGLTLQAIVSAGAPAA